MKGHEAGLETQRHLRAEALAQQQERSQVRLVEPDGLLAGGTSRPLGASSMGALPTQCPSICHLLYCAVQGAHPGAAGVGNKYAAAEREVLEVEREKVREDSL